MGPGQSRQPQVHGCLSSSGQVTASASKPQGTPTAEGKQRHFPLPLSPLGGSELVKRAIQKPKTYCFCHQRREAETISYKEDKYALGCADQDPTKCHSLPRALLSSSGHSRSHPTELKECRPPCGSPRRGSG